MKGRAPAEPAPSRGCYDRALSRQARQSEQRERLVDWMAEMYRQRGEQVTVQDVVQAAGVGRNTFYEYFDGLEHGLAHATQTVSKLLYERTVSELEASRTPIARLRALSRLWFELLDSEPAPMALLSRPVSEGAMSEGVVLFQALLSRALLEKTPGAARADEATQLCAALAAVGASGAVRLGVAGRQEMQEALSLLMQRVFR